MTNENQVQEIALNQQRKRDEDEYFQLLGRFVHAIAQAEDSLNASLRTLAHQAVLAIEFPKKAANGRSAGIQAASEALIKALRETQADQAIQSSTKLVLDQLSILSELRNKLAHYDAMTPTVGPDRVYFLSNLSTHQSTNQLESTSFDLRTFRNAIRDTKVIPIRLAASLDPKYELSIRSSSIAPDIFGLWHFKKSDLILGGPKHI